MKFKLCAYIFVGAVMFAAQAVANPLTDSYLSVDIDGQNGTTGTAGVTQAGYQPWAIVGGADSLSGAYDPATDWSLNGLAPTGLTKTFATALGNVNATLIGVSYNGTTLADNRAARNRGANGQAQGSLYQDFVFSQINNQASGANFGRNYIKLVLSGPGITANKTYSFTGYAREDAFNSNAFLSPTAPSVSFQAWSDLATLGVDGPAAWMDANVSAGAAYAPAVGGANDVIPHLRRSQISGPDLPNQPLYYSTTFRTKADASGKITVYTWSDPNDPQISTTQGAALLNGFQLAVPEPASLVLFAVGLVGIVGLRRRMK
jgi:hypothetical protein